MDILNHPKRENTCKKFFFLQKAELIILFSFECGFYITFGTLFTSLHTKTKEILLSLEFNVTWVSKKTFTKQAQMLMEQTSS